MTCRREGCESVRPPHRKSYCSEVCARAARHRRRKKTKGERRRRSRYKHPLYREFRAATNPAKQLIVKGNPEAQAQARVLIERAGLAGLENVRMLAVAVPLRAEDRSRIWGA